MKDDKHSEETFERLWTDYLEGDLDEAGVETLRALLQDDPGLLQRVGEMYQTHRLLGFLSKNDSAATEAFVRDTMKRLPLDSEAFTSGVMQRQRAAASAGRWTQTTALRRAAAVASWAIVAFAAWMVLSYWQGGPSRTRQPSVTTASEPVRFTRLARATFFGELTPSVQSPAPPHKEYILTSGLAELRFPSGATAILEGPAVFRVKADDLLAMDAGQCSVHAPPGAEGFRLETPASTVVDRGTRFAVQVNEASETEVQVIEGIADVYPVTDSPASGAIQSTAAQEFRLTEQQALRVLSQVQPTASPAAFDPGAYRASLPDRLVTFTAAMAADGGAERLTSVTVQRDGEEIHYPLEALIPAELIWFKPTPGTRSPGHLIGPAVLPEDRRSLFFSASFSSGAINPGGSPQPLTTDPVLTEDGGTPGMAVRFSQPVRNGPGPDVVFFDIQPVSLPPEGDPFHVSPLRFTPGLKSLTIRSYDVNMLSPESLRIHRPHVHMVKGREVRSLDDLLTRNFTGRPFRTVYRVVATGIDLSDLGYSAGATVDGLFFQDAEDDDLRVDPVFIAGLP